MNEPNINETFEAPRGGYGRIWESMYKGSMINAGIEVFAVWPYVIANMRGHPEHGALVELNPELLQFIFGTKTTEPIERAIKVLCAPDAKSRNKSEAGRRLVNLGQFLYRVVNGAEYLSIRKKEANKQAHREAQSRYRKRKKIKPGQPLPGERAALEHGVTIHEHREARPAEDNGEPPVEEAGLLQEKPEE